MNAPARDLRTMERRADMRMHLGRAIDLCDDVATANLLTSIRRYCVSSTRYDPEAIEAAAQAVDDDAGTLVEQARQEAGALEDWHRGIK